MRGLEKCYPPGYAYRGEMGIAGILWGMAVGSGAVYFLQALYSAIEKLYHYVDYRRVLREGVRVVPFTELVEGYWALFVPVLVFLLVMPLYHYAYYCRESKSIYVMRRLPQRGVTLKSCVRGPVLCAGLVLTSAVIFYFLYYGIYCLSVPGEAMPRFV